VVSMGKMWNRFKTFILNIFTEEVEVILPEDKLEQEKENIDWETHRKKDDTHHSVRKQTNDSFRFPVIPDTPKNRSENPALKEEKRYIERLADEKQAAYHKQLKTNHEKEMRNRNEKLSSDQEIGYEKELEMRLKAQKERRRNRHLNRAPSVQTYMPETERGFVAYEKEKSLKNIDHIPAYKRREKVIKQYEQPDLSAEAGYDDMGDKHQKPEKIVYSTPDELDDVFRKIHVRSHLRSNEAQEKTIIEATPFADMSHDDKHVNNLTKEPEAKKKADNLRNPVKKINEEQIQKYADVTPNIEEQEEKESPSSTFKHEAESKEKHWYMEQRRSVHQQAKMQAADEKNNETIESVHYDVPHHLLDDPEGNDIDDLAWVEEQQYLLERTLTHFKIRAKVVHVTQGPTVTRFEIQPELGVKVSTIRNLADDLKLNLAAKEIRIEAPIPGKNTVGIEIPNAYPQMVTLQHMIESAAFTEAESPLSIALGLTIEGDPLITNIEKMPHGLIAGATGSGKSVCINTILLSLMYKANHEDVKFMLIDPKMVELAPYNGIPHLVSPVITDVKAATAALKWAVQEMEARYEKFVEAQVRHIEKYNEKIATNKFSGEKMPYLVIVIDELADLMMVSPQDVEDSISRIAQKARACGIHLLLATQRPSVDVITGLIKANIPTRIAFTVSSQVDSRTILDSNGAEKLLGKGDMLFMENGSGRSLRLQGPFVSDEEIERVTAYMREIAEPNYLFEQEELLVQADEKEQDELFEEVILFVLEQNQASTSLLQRQFRIGYNRAARLMDTLYEAGIISAQNGSKPREVLITYEQAEQLFFT